MEFISPGLEHLLKVGLTYIYKNVHTCKAMLSTHNQYLFIITNHNSRGKKGHYRLLLFTKQILSFTITENIPYSYTNITHLIYVKVELN